MEDKPKIILGIDPGTIVLGYAIIEVYQKKITLITLGVIQLRKISDMYKRLANIYSRIDNIVKEFNPDEVAIEAQFFGKDVLTRSGCRPVVLGPCAVVIWTHRFRGPPAAEPVGMSKSPPLAVLSASTGGFATKTVASLRISGPVWQAGTGRSGVETGQLPSVVSGESANAAPTT